MAQSYYPDTEDTAEPAPAPADSSAEDTEQESESDTEDLGQTFTVQKSVFGDRDIQPKDRVVMEAVHIYDDEIAFRPVGEGEEKETKAEGMSANEEIDSAATMPMKGMY